MNLIVSVNDRDEQLFDKLTDNKNENLLFIVIGSAISGDTMIIRNDAEWALQFMLKFQLYLDKQNCKAKTNEKYTDIKELVDKGVDIIQRDMEDMGWL